LSECANASVQDRCHPLGRSALPTCPSIPVLYVRAFNTIASGSAGFTLRSTRGHLPVGIDHKRGALVAHAGSPGPIAQGHSDASCAKHRSDI
jgi:hypothetical protein